MAIHYRIVEHKNSLPNAKTPTTAYAVAKQVGKVTVKELAEDIADRTTLHRSDVIAVLDVLSVSATSFLQKGLGVDLGELGNFSIRLKSKSTEKKEEFASKNIINTSVRYVPSPEMKLKLSNVSFSDIDSLTLPEGQTPAPANPGSEGSGSEGSGSGDPSAPTDPTGTEGGGDI